MENIGMAYEKTVRYRDRDLIQYVTAWTKE